MEALIQRATKRDLVGEQQNQSRRLSAVFLKRPFSVVAVGDANGRIESDALRESALLVTCGNSSWEIYGGVRAGQRCDRVKRGR